MGEAFARHSPAPSRDPLAFLIDKLSTGLHSPAVMLREESPACCGGVIPLCCVCVLQRREFLFPEDLKGHKIPNKEDKAEA